MQGCTVEVDLFERVKDVRAKELNAGPSSTLCVKTKKSRKTPTGILHYSHPTSFRIKETTDTIKAEVGAEFGMEFVLWTNERTYVPIAIKWTYPEVIVNDKGKKFKSYKYRSNQPTRERIWTSYGMGKDFMVKKGEWKVEIFHKKKVILEKIFYLI